jgi:Sigma 54 modulation/S30EA ribosomal protein C terminus
VAEATAGLPVGVAVGTNGSSASTATETVGLLEQEQEQEQDQPADDTASLIVRDKTHAAEPMTSADALHEMELVGHDFFLFVDEDSGRPSVVYRRKGYDYGVIALDVTATGTT